MTSPSPSGQDRAGFEVTDSRRGNPNPPQCPDCPHDLAVHSREPGIGCLHSIDHDEWVNCGCLRVGTSEADQ